MSGLHTHQGIAKLIKIKVVLTNLVVLEDES